MSLLTRSGSTFLVRTASLSVNLIIALMQTKSDAHYCELRPHENGSHETKLHSFRKVFLICNPLCIISKFFARSYNCYKFPYKSQTNSFVLILFLNHSMCYFCNGNFFVSPQIYSSHFLSSPNKFYKFKLLYSGINKNKINICLLKSSLN